MYRSDSEQNGDKRKAQLDIVEKQICAVENLHNNRFGDFSRNNDVSYILLLLLSPSSFTSSIYTSHIPIQLVIATY